MLGKVAFSTAPLLVTFCTGTRNPALLNIIYRNKCFCLLSCSLRQYEIIQVSAYFSEKYNVFWNQYCSFSMKFEVIPLEFMCIESHCIMGYCLQG